MSNYRAKKRFGQHFLVSADVIHRIIDLVSPKSDMDIVEIGPGRAALTELLVESGAKITAVEFDRDVITFLESKFRDDSNLTIINRDFLKSTPDEFGTENFALVGNLPYNITSPVLEWTVQHRAAITQAVFMMQKEVALRVSSRPGNKNWSPIALFTQLYFEIEYGFDVGPECFDPPPKVNSAVVRLIRKPEPVIEHFAEFEKLVRASFVQRRKLLVNNLVPSIIPDSTTAREIVAECGLGPNTRAEEISTVNFLKLTDLLVAHKMF